MAMIKILELTPKQQGLVKRLNRIIKKFEEEGVGTIIQTYDVDFCCIRFYNREKVVWSETEPVEIGECEELLKHEDDGYYSSDIAEKLQKYEKLTWCCPDPEEMYRIPFVSFVGEAPNPWIPVENRDIISLVIDKYDLDLFPIKKGGKFGYATEDGKVIIPCKWMDAKAFSEGYAVVMDENGMYGYIGKYGDIVIQCEWEDAKPFKDGFAEVMDENGEWYSIDSFGKIYREGLAISVGENGKYGFINKKGKLVIPHKWKEAWLFREGLAVVQDDNDKYGYINKTGELVIPCKWTDARDFYDGKADVTDEDGIDYSIDKSGYSFHEGLALVKGENGKYGFIDKSLNLVIPHKWENAFDFSEGLAPAENQDQKWGYIDKKGKCVIPFKWSAAFPYSDGLAAVMDETDKNGYIDKKGKLIIPCKWEMAFEFTNGHAEVWDEDIKKYIIDKSGNVISKLDIADDA